MTKPINLYLHSRVERESTFNVLLNHVSGPANHSHTKAHEVQSVRALVEGLTRCGLSPAELDDFYLGYCIPRIGKEFDLLKLTRDHVLNIELKYRGIALHLIRQQLLRNKYYLGHRGRTMEFYTVVAEPLTCYMLDREDHLVEVDITAVAASVLAVRGMGERDVDSLFQASDYLVSPLHTPERFVRGAYFLTQAQEQARKKMLASFLGKSSGFYSLTGRPGTGKTLLLYDIAKSMAKCAGALVIACGGLTLGQEVLNRTLPGFSVVCQEQLHVQPELTKRYRFVFVDEAQKLERSLFDTLTRQVPELGQFCVFSSDPGQVQTEREAQSAICQSIRALPLLGSCELRERLRMAAGTAGFLARLEDLKKKSGKKQDFSSISLSFAPSQAEGAQILDYYRQRGYTLIHTGAASRPYYRQRTDCTVYEACGREFDKVVLVMDDSFSYDKDKVLQSPQKELFLQGACRTRQELALVVTEAPALFEKLVGLLK